MKSKTSKIKYVVLKHLATFEERGFVSETSHTITVGENRTYVKNSEEVKYCNSVEEASAYCMSILHQRICTAESALKSLQEQKKQLKLKVQEVYGINI